jgi:hypothetical protein
MATITLDYNTRNSLAVKTLDYILSLGVFATKDISEKSPYNKEFVDKIKRSEKSKGVKIKTEDLWK